MLRVETKHIKSQKVRNYLHILFLDFREWEILLKEHYPECIQR